MQPIRQEQDEEIIHDPWIREEQKLGQSDTQHVVGDAGGIESHRTGRRVGCVCGCLKPAGGFCGECIQPVCVDCYGFCAGDCHKPLCPRHSVFVPVGDGTTLRLCQSCHGARSRRKLVWGVVRGLLSPFIRFTDSDGQR